MIQFLKNFPDLFSRMLKHLPYISPIADIFNKLVASDDLHPQLGIIAWLHEAELVPQVLALLDPSKAAIAAHTPAGDLLRGMVAASSAASATKQQQQQQAQAKVGGDADANGQPAAAVWSNWPNNALVRELASRTTVRTLLGYILDSDVSYKQRASGNQLSIEGQPSVNSMTTVDEDDAITPTITPETSRDVATTPQSVANPEAVTSSLLNSLTLIIDIIRKNNSDFTELQILQYLERAHGGFDPDAEDESGDMAGEGEEDIGRVNVMEQGPSLVDLEPLLRELTARLPDLHELLQNPRSNVSLVNHNVCHSKLILPEKVSPIPSTLQGKQRQEPLTFERFRICELYAELLHCSNMAILNRPQQREETLPAPSYDSLTGRIEGTRKQAFERLGNALNAHSDPSAPEAQHNDRLPNGESSLSQSLDEDDSRPVTAQSDVTSSYTSGASETADDKEDSEDVFDALNVAAEGLSLDDDAASLHFPNSNPPSASNSPMPPQTAQFGSSSSPYKGSNMQNGDLSSSPAVGSRQPHTPQQTKQVEPPPLLAGQALKRAFIDLQIVPAVLDLFFRFPWNNFLHNVVYDLVQQIFNGKLEDGLNRELCVAVFTQQGGLIDRLLKAVEENSRIFSEPNGVRLGHMGHVTLISEEIVKLFYDNLNDILHQIPVANFDRTRWEAFVEGILRETRERDLQPLGGGISIAMHGSISAGSAGHAGIVDIDDEFPAQGRVFHNVDVESNSSPDSSPDKAHFARYLASQISSDLPAQPGKNALNISTSSSASSSSGSSSSDDAPTFAEYQGSPCRQSSGLDNAAATWFSVGNEGDSAFDDYDDDDETTSAVGQKLAKTPPNLDLSNAHPTHPSQTRKIHDATAGIVRQERFGFEVSARLSSFLRRLTGLGRIASIQINSARAIAMMTRI